MYDQVITVYFLTKFLQSDFVQTGLSTLTFNESGTQNILVNIVNDSVIENSEFFTIILSNPQPDDVMLDPDTISITIVDNDEREFLDH